MGNNFLVARWNGTSAWHATALHPVHGAQMSIKLNPRVPQPVQSFWLGIPEFAACLTDEEGEKVVERDKISYWYADKVPETPKIDFSDLSPNVEMTADLRESLRQVLVSDFTEIQRDLLELEPGFERSITRAWASEVYKPFLKRVIKEEKRFQNRPGVISVCEATIRRLRELE